MAQGICSVDGCERTTGQRRLCGIHYMIALQLGALPPAGPRERSIEDRFWPKVDKRGPDECWPWLGSLQEGYGQILYQGSSQGAHRVSYRLFVGAIPKGLHLDHVCHSTDPDCIGGDDCPHRACVNPAHLEPVTAQENARRGYPARKTHCKSGHLYDEANTHYTKDRGGRHCRACAAERARERKDRERAQAQELADRAAFYFGRWSAEHPEKDVTISPEGDA